MKIDDITYERIMTETPIEDLEASWRIAGFTAARKWCDSALVMGRGEGLAGGIFVGMSITSIVNGILLAVDTERTWVGIVGPLIFGLVMSSTSGGLSARHQLFMYGKAEKKCDSEEHNANADDKPSNDPTVE